MRFFLCLFAVFTMAVVFYSQTPPQPRAIHELLSPGQPRSDLQQIGLTSNLTPGTPIYFRTNLTSSGTIRKQSPNHTFENGEIAPALLIRWNDGSERWINRNLLTKTLVGPQAKS
jgi:hypothetical protein